MTSIAKTFCKKYQAEQAIFDGNYHLEFYDSIEDVEHIWESIILERDIFFGVPFLKCIEKDGPSGISPYYCVIKNSQAELGVIYFQSKYVRLKENLRKTENKNGAILQKLTKPLKNAVIHAVNVQTIVCGNLLLTGKYGYFFDHIVSNDEALYIISKATEKLIEYLHTKNIHSSLCLVKDLFEKDLPQQSDNHFGYTQFSVQPKMILDILPEWNNFDDYVESMKSKYRVRTKKALAKCKEIVKIQFGVQDIVLHREVIHSLYKNISDLADFNAFILSKTYFEHLKEALGDQMTFTAYWKGDKMVAFFTSIKNFDVLDAHFLGYDVEENIHCQLYLNMLFDLIKEGIEKKVEVIDLSRTAIEIKSTVGAVPHDMYLFLKHSNPLLNKMVASVLGLVKPQPEFVIRSPFREEG